MPRTMARTIASILIAALVSADPECSPKTSNNDWYKCTNDGNAWYGIVSSKEGIYQATSQCTAAGGSVISVTDEKIDACAFNTMYATKSDETGQVANEFVYFSGSFGSRNTWYWTQNFAAQGDKFSYTNWGENVDPGSGDSDCMGGYLGKNSFTFNEYYWQTQACKGQSEYRVMCRVDCADQLDAGTYFSIAAFSSGDTPRDTLKEILVYELVNNVAQANPVILKVPYSCSLPMMTWNYEQNALQLVGDKLLPSNPKLIDNQGFLKLDGNWTEMNPNTFDGRWGASPLYRDNIGTILIGGSMINNVPLASVIQLYAPLAWGVDEPVAFPDMNYARIRVTVKYNEGSIYAAGGGEFLYVDGVWNYLEVMNNVDAVAAPSDVSGLAWSVLPALATAATAGNIHVIDSTLYWFGYTAEVYTNSTTSSWFMEAYDLETSASVAVYDPAFQVYNYMAASFTDGTQMTVLGGFGRAQPQITEQGASSDNFASFQNITSNFTWTDNGQGAYLQYSEFTIN